MSTANSKELLSFNPRVLAGGRDTGKIVPWIKPLVSIHASSREDATTVIFISTQTHCFNPRVLAGGRDTPKQVAWAEDISFNPRVLAGGRDVRKVHNLQDVMVSIHASSREDATFFPVYLLAGILFQSTRPRGRTRL